MEPFFFKLHGAILGASLFLGTVAPTSYPLLKPAATSTKKAATSTQQKTKKTAVTTTEKKKTSTSSFVTPTAIIPQKAKDDQKTKNQPSKTQSIDSYSSSDNVRSRSSFFYSKQKPCSSPIGYKLGSFDSRFTISKQEFLAAMSESSSLWSVSYGKPLFVYDEKGPLTVNLIYDTRQMSTQELNYLSLEIDNT